MQKFTIFTIILSTIVVTIITELVVQDYLQRVYNPTALQASTLGADNFESFVTPVNESEETKSPTETLIEKLQENDLKSDDSDQDTESLTEKLDNIRPSSRDEVIDQELTDNATLLSRVDTLLPALQLPGVALQKSAYQNKLFQLISTAEIDFAETAFATLQVDQEIIGSVYEFKARTEIDAEKAFDDIRILANSFPNISTNQTNQFGDKSFYINHLVKVGEVFVVVQRDDRIFAFAYKKDYHESFKTFFGVLFSALTLHLESDFLLIFA